VRPGYGARDPARGRTGPDHGAGGPIEERRATWSEVRGLPLFLANAVRGVAKVSAVQDDPSAVGQADRRIGGTFLALTRGSSGRYFPARDAGPWWL
jgi:hypothetical protein